MDGYFVPYERQFSLNQDLTFDTAEAILDANGCELDPSRMALLGLTDGGRYTNLAFILSDQFDQITSLVRYGDAAGDSYIERDLASGSVLGQLMDSVAFVERHNRRRSRIRGFYREDLRDYPEDVFTECLVNAVAHRDYRLRGTLLVHMYEDRLVVTSPGGLYGGIGIDDIVSGMSARRNEGLSSLLHGLGLMGCSGAGIPLMMGMYSDEPSGPTIQTSTNVFKVTVPTLTFHDTPPR